MILHPYRYVLLYSCTLLSIITNCTLGYFILFKTRSDIGCYKYFLLCFVCYDLSYTAVIAVVNPIIHCTSFSYLIFSAGPFWNAHFGNVLASIYSVAYCQIISMLAFHFVYRYISLCKSHLLHIFRETRYIILFILFFLFTGIIWFFNCMLVMQPTHEMRLEMAPSLRERFDIDVFEIQFTGGAYWLPSPDGGWSFEWRYFAGIAITHLTLYCVIGMISYCSLNIYCSMSASSLSEKTRFLQKQLFRALLLQSTIPTVLLFVPCFVTKVVPIFGLDVGSFTDYATHAFSLYPVLDPIVSMLFIGDYRRALVSVLRCGREQRVGSVSNTSNGTSQTAGSKTLPPILPSTKQPSLHTVGSGDL